MGRLRSVSYGWGSGERFIRGRVTSTLAAAGRWAIADVKAYPGVGSALTAAMFLAVWIEAIRAGNLQALFDDAVCGAEILVDALSDGRPAVVIVGALSLQLEILEDVFAILLDGCDVAEEGVAL